jgi:hypothetical protein
MTNTMNTPGALAAAENVCDYQVWRYKKSFNVINEHQLVADGYSQGSAEQLCANSNRDTLCESVYQYIHGREVEDDVEYYIRRHGEPSYLLYNVFQDGSKRLYDIVYHKKAADKKTELLQAVADKLAATGGPRFTTVIEPRDDNDDRGEILDDREMPALESDDSDDDMDENLSDFINEVRTISRLMSLLCNTEPVRFGLNDEDDNILD